jgi:peptidoglycan-associated lipoprotein
MRTRTILALSLALVCIAGASVGCKKKAPETTPPPPAPTEAAKPTTPPPEPKTEVTDKFPKEPVESAPVTEPSVDEWNRRKPLQTVYFGYDSSELDASAKSALQANADWLKANGKRAIRIEGHCDERGTIKYNIALGERRANSVREYLEGLGVSSSRVRIVSYGEERPVDPGHGEDSWKQNRRAEFWIES